MAASASAGVVLLLLSSMKMYFTLRKSAFHSLSPPS